MEYEKTTFEIMSYQQRYDYLVDLYYDVMNHDRDLYFDLCNLIPDGADYDDFEQLAEDEKQFERIVYWDECNWNG